MDISILFEGAAIADDLTNFAAMFVGKVRSWTRAAKSPVPLSVSVATALQDIEALKPEWHILEKSSISLSPFQTYAFHAAWARHYCDASSQPRFLTVRDEGRLVLIMPLVVKTGALGATASWAGDPLLQYGDVVMARGTRERVETWLDAALETIRSWTDVVYIELGRVRDGTSLGSWAARRMESGGEIEVSPVFNALRGGELSTTDSRFQRLAKQEKRLRKQGALRFEVLGAGSRAAELVETAHRFKRDWLQQRGHFGRAFLDPRAEACLADLARDPANPSGLSVFCLSVDSEPIAIEVGFRLGECNYGFMGAFSQAYAKFSPGSLLTDMTVRHCLADGVAVYDPLPPSDPYKLVWSNDLLTARRYSLLLSPVGAAARLFSLRLKPGAKWLYSRLPLKLRTAMRNMIS